MACTQSLGDSDQDQGRINPVNAQLAARCGEQAPSLFDLSGLQAGARVSIVLLGAPQERVAFAIQDQTAPWKD
jgi:hypothetical protein